MTDVHNRLHSVTCMSGGVEPRNSRSVTRAVLTYTDHTQLSVKYQQHCKVNVSQCPVHLSTSHRLSVTHLCSMSGELSTTSIQVGCGVCNYIRQHQPTGYSCYGCWTWYFLPFKYN